jgi:photosystem II stability/assembly factor-like uncharacterized protein
MHNMKGTYSLLILILVMFGCRTNEKGETRPSFTKVEVETILEDTISVRALEVMGKNLAFGANHGRYGLYNDSTKEWKVNLQEQDSVLPEFRAVASTENDFFMLSVGNPALLYKTGDDGKMDLVYREDNEKVFYDAMTFWNDQEGIAIGDPTEKCLSVIITRDGGNTWDKLSCANLPETAEGEAAFAASNSNIAIAGDNTWILSGGMKSRVFFSPNKGKTWEVFETPLLKGESTTGGYSMDFYNENEGIIVGGDYTKPEINKANIAVTKDGGKTWNLVSDGKGPGYLSGVRYVTNSQAKEVVAVGPAGIFYSEDSGNNWINISKEAFHTIRFVTDSTAYAGGTKRIAKLKFK